MITIVIVEDQGILRESLACTLNLQEDMQVARALSDAADALDVVRETNANLALLDVCTEKRIERNRRSEADSRSLPRYENRNYDRHAGNHVHRTGKARWS